MEYEKQTENSLQWSMATPGIETADSVRDELLLFGKLK